MKRTILAAALFALGGAAHAEALNLNVGSRAVHLDFGGPMGQVSSAAHGVYEVGGLYHSQDNADYKEAYVGLGVHGDMGVTNAKVDAGVGLRGMYVDNENGNGEVVAFTGNVNMRFPQINRFVFSLEGAYSPDPLSFGDAKEYTELGLSAGYEVIHNAQVYFGYRNVGADFGGGRHTVDNGFLGGVLFQF
jgi:hypothetical protein